MLERIERQQTNSKDRTLRKGLDIGKDIVKQRNMTKKETKDDSPRNDDSLKELYERQKNEIIHRKLDTKEIERDSEKVVNNGRKNNYGNLKEKENSDSVVKVKMEVKDKKCNSFKEEIDERLKTIDRT